MTTGKSEIRDGMRIDWDTPIEMDDGVVVRADVFRPVADGKYPVIMNYGPYAKGHAFQDSRKFAWERMIAQKPEVAAGSSNKYQNWEVVDPEKWVPDGYAVVRVDSRGTGRSPGYVDPWSPRETRDIYECIEWAAAQPWCSGKVGLNGISYFAMNRGRWPSLRRPIWPRSARGKVPPITTARPAIMAASIPNSSPTGIRALSYRFNMVLASAARAAVSQARRSRGRRRLTPEELERTATISSPMRSSIHSMTIITRARGRSREDRRCRCFRPQIGAGRACTRAATLKPSARAGEAKMAGGARRHPLAQFYTDYGVTLQKRFFGHFLKGQDNGMEQTAGRAA